jgi:hypothetical protein
MGLMSTCSACRSDWCVNAECVTRSRDRYKKALQRIRLGGINIEEARDIAEAALVED